MQPTLDIRRRMYFEFIGGKYFEVTIKVLGIQNLKFFWNGFEYLLNSGQESNGLESEK